VKKGRKVSELDIRDAGGILNKNIIIEFQDTRTDPSTAFSKFDSLVSRGVQAVIGPSSSVMPSLVDSIRSAQIPLLSPTAGTLQLDDVGGK
jgi:ABC-type branched-subunit amino acid transport system substrate-binding protein